MGDQLNPKSLHKGHRWIEQLATDLAKTRNLKIEIQGWADATVWPSQEPGTIQTLHDRQALVFDARRKRHSIEFDRALIDDCAEEDYDKVHRAKALAILKERLQEV